MSSERSKGCAETCWFGIDFDKRQQQDPLSRNPCGLLWIQNGCIYRMDVQGCDLLFFPFLMLIGVNILQSILLMSVNWTTSQTVSTYLFSHFNFSKFLLFWRVGRGRISLGWRAYLIWKIHPWLCSYRVTCLVGDDKLGLRNGLGEGLKNPPPQTISSSSRDTSPSAFVSSDLPTPGTSEASRQVSAQILHFLVTWASCFIFLILHSLF